MKRDDVRAIIPDADEDTVDAILNKVRDELNPLKRQLTEATDGLTSAQAELEQLKGRESDCQRQLEDAKAKIEAGMSAEELLAQKQAEADQREREFLLKSNALDARTIFVGAGVDPDSIDALVEQVTSEDADRTAKAAQLIVDTLAKQRESVEASVKDAILKDNPKPKGGSAGAITTWDEFSKLPVSEQIAMKQANPDIVRELIRK